MFPIALRVGDLTITWYGVLAAAGFFAGVRYAVGRARRDGLSVAHVEWLAFWILVTALVGSRAVFVLTQLPYYLDHPLEVFTPGQGGLVFLGGVFAALAAGAIYVRRHRLSFARYADASLPGVALGHAFGRVGCFAVGCCHGRTAEGIPWAVRFPESPWRQIAPAGVALHPVQLYEAGIDLAIFAALALLHRRRRFPGQIGLAYLGMYAAARIVLELFRGDVARGFLFADLLGPRLSTSQFTAVLLLAGVMLVWWRASARHSNPPVS